MPDTRRAAISEAASRARAVHRLLEHVKASRIELDDSLLSSLVKLSARCALWSAVAEEQVA